MDEEADIVDWPALRALRAEVGAGFGRILGYFREDGVKSIAAVEAAMARRDAAALVIPAHTLKGEALQFGARPLALLAERIELVARDCVEAHSAPDALAADVARLKPLFDRTLAILGHEPPASPARPVFGRRTFGLAMR